MMRIVPCGGPQGNDRGCSAFGGFELNGDGLKHAAFDVVDADHVRPHGNHYVVFLGRLLLCCQREI